MKILIYLLIFVVWLMLSSIFYKQFFKRFYDIVCALLAIIVFSWLYILIAVLVRAKLGSPILYKQVRPGKIDSKTGKEKLFTIYKFRTMNDETDENGKLLSDEIRLTKFGKWLRTTSLDELPEAFNILKGDMSVVGPRPWLIKYLPFYSKEEHHRHDVRPGLTGLAQIHGRNYATWKDRIEYDLEYVKKVSFFFDIQIIFKTIYLFLKREDIASGNELIMEDFDIERKHENR